MVPEHLENKKPVDSISSDPSTPVAASPACPLPGTPAPSSTGGFKRGPCSVFLIDLAVLAWMMVMSLEWGFIPSPLLSELSGLPTELELTPRLMYLQHFCVVSTESRDLAGVKKLGVQGWREREKNGCRVEGMDDKEREQEEKRLLENE
eukprot:g33096.t1